MWKNKPKIGTKHDDEFLFHSIRFWKWNYWTNSDTFWVMIYFLYHRNIFEEIGESYEFLYGLNKRAIEVISFFFSDKVEDRCSRILIFEEVLLPEKMQFNLNHLTGDGFVTKVTQLLLLLATPWVSVYLIFFFCSACSRFFDPQCHSAAPDKIITS